MRTLLRLMVMALLVVVVLFASFAAGFGLNYYNVQNQPQTVVPKDFGLFWDAPVPHNKVMPGG